MTGDVNDPLHPPAGGLAVPARSRQWRGLVDELVRPNGPPTGESRVTGTVRGTQLEPDRTGPYPARIRNREPFKYVKTSREIIGLAVTLYIRFPLSLRNVEDLLHERGIDVSHEAVR